VTVPDRVDVAESPHDRGLRWALGLWATAICFFLLALGRSLQIGIPLRDPHFAIFGSRMAISLGLFFVLVVGHAVYRAGWPVRLAKVWSALRRRWTARRLALALAALFAYHVVYFSYHNLKSWDVFNTPRDADLLHWDRALFFGHDPAVLLHSLLGQHYAMYILLVIYESFSTVLEIAVVAAVALPLRIRDSYAFITSGVWVWILGTLSYYSIPSLGPFAIAPENFRGLPHTMIQDTQARYMAQRAQMLEHPLWHTSFAQISAFASLHIGLTSLLLLMARWFGLRRITAVFAVWVPLTAVATLYIGWHYFLDDVAGFLIAWVGVAIGTRMVYPGGVRPPIIRERAAAADSVTEAPGEPVTSGDRGALASIDEA
jgi:membrane-associated phospholipid phosphatase